MRRSTPAQPFLRRGHPLNRGLAGGWPMCEGGGTTTRDLSGRGNHATLTNGPTRVVTEMGRAIRFIDDGTCQHLLCSALPTPMASGPFLFAAWIKPTLNDNNTVFALRASVNPSFRFPYMASTPTEARWFASASNYRRWTIPAVDGATWHHVALYVPGFAQTDIDNTILWVDGSECAIIETVSTGTASARNSLRLGGDSVTYDFDGLMTAASVYAGLLATSAIRRLAGWYGDSFEQWRPMLFRSNAYADVAEYVTPRTTILRVPVTSDTVARISVTSDTVRRIDRTSDTVKRT